MLEYREMTLSDLPALAEMYVDAFNAAPWNDEWTAETAGKRLRQMMNTEDSFGLCAYENGELAGMVLGADEQFYNGVMFDVKEFCVRSALRGKGLGSAIFAELEARLKARGVGEIILYTASGDSTKCFYQSRGMSVCDGMIMMNKRI